MKLSVCLAILLVCCGLSIVAAHNHLMAPIPRNPEAYYIGNDNCENSKTDIPKENTFQRGQIINTKWSYNNHHGGFIRFAIVPMGKETKDKPFNQGENILLFTCFGKTCGGPNAPLDEGDQMPCGTALKIPTHLPDGNYVLQWIMYSSYVAEGREDRGLPNYTSCANIKIQGGTKTNEVPGKCSFQWIGGDTEYTRGKVKRLGDLEKDTCAYFMRNTLGPSFDTVVNNADFIKIGGRPKEVEDCRNPPKPAPRPNPPKERPPVENINKNHGLKNGQIVSIKCLGATKVEKHQFIYGNLITSKVVLAPTPNDPYIGARWRVKVHRDGSVSFQCLAGNKFLDMDQNDNLKLSDHNNKRHFHGTYWNVAKLADGSFSLKTLSYNRKKDRLFIDGDTVQGLLKMAPETGGVFTGTHWEVKVL